MGEKPEDMQLRLWIAMLRAISRAVDGTFNTKTFAPASKRLEPEESRLPEVLDLLERLRRDAIERGSLSKNDVRLIKELFEEAMLRGLEARERREVRAAAIRVVGKDRLRHALVNFLILDGFDSKRFMWRRSFEEFEMTEREKRAALLSRPRKNDYGVTRRQLNDVEETLGWAKPDKSRRKRIPSIELAEHFAQPTQSKRRRVVLTSSSTGISRKFNAPMGGLQALEELKELHEIQSREACLRTLQRVKQRYDKLYAEFEHLKDESVFEARLHNFPDLSNLPYKWGGRLEERTGTA